MKKEDILKNSHNGEKGEVPRVSANLGGDFEPDNIYAMMLTEASRVLSETEPCGMISPRVTAFLTESGSLCCAVNTDKPGAVSSDEKRVLHSLRKSGDSVVKKMVTLWLDGTVGSACLQLYKEVLSLNGNNANAEVLLARTVRNTYKWHFLPADYKIKYLKEFII